MAVEDAADRIRYEFVVVIAVDQHAENAGDGALPLDRRARAGAAARRTRWEYIPWRSAARPSTRSRAEPWQSVSPSPSAPILSDGERQISAYRRISAGSSEVETASTERARPAAPSVLQEFLHFTAAFSDEADDGNVRRNITGKHRQEDRLADAGARENTHALAAADRDERVERAHAKIERLTNAARGMRRWRQRAVATARPATALTRRSYRVGRKLIVGQADHAAERASYEVVALRLSSPP